MYNANQNEEEILRYWAENKSFERSVFGRDDNKPYAFYDGPPFATGLPHYGHIVASLMKDVIPRYFTMRGYRVERRWGWDCHGLPVENIIESDLNLRSKKDIENFGVANFNEACRSSVLKYAEDWRKTVKRIGRWVDMDNDYKTMDANFMESVWWVFRSLWDRDLIYKGHKAMHICPRCATPLSNFEVTQGYKDVTDISVTAKFKLLNPEKAGLPGGTCVLAWTTTPWTLPGNVLLAVRGEVEYVVVDLGGEKLIVAKERLEGVFKDKNYTVVGEKTGDDLVGLEYEPLFPYFAETKNAFRVVPADFVTTIDGTGVVHIAPAFGEDDYNLGKKENVGFVQHVGMDGRFIKEVLDFAGVEVKPIDDPTSTDVLVIKWLAAQGKLFAKEKFTHSYPHCWRCDTPLLNYATSSWFVKVTHFKDLLLKTNAETRWVPEHIRDGRFGKWLEGAHDWAISRNRFWGTPLPVWESEDGDAICVGSVEEMAKLTNKKLTKIIFVRHGESEMNVNSSRSSALDKNPLTEKGRKSVEKMAENFTDKVDAVFASPVLRARQTAEILQKKLGNEIIFDDLIKEYNNGKWEEKTIQDLQNDSAYLEYKKTSNESIRNKFTFRLGETGETREEIIARVREFVDEILREYSGKTIMVVSHGGIFACINHVIRGTSDEKFIADEDAIDFNSTRVFNLDENGKEFDLHKHRIDNLTIEKNGKIYKRIPEVLDCWFESGSMPYAEMHYPFENKEKFEARFPAEFIAEGQDQTRGWFYTLHVLATALTLGDSPAISKEKVCPAFQNVIVNGIVLAEDGKKMSKRLKNYPDPTGLIEKYGADAMRMYLATSPVMRAENLNFSEMGVREVYNKAINMLWNVVEFYKMYGVSGAKTGKKSTHVLDRWIMSRLSQLIREVTQALDSYEIADAARPIMAFIDDLSTWYLRRSRDRFKSGDVGEQTDASNTLHLVFVELAKVIAPFAPFLAEKLNLELGDADSIHLSAWPQNDLYETDEAVLKNMEIARQVVEIGLALRVEAGVKVKQPLGKIVYMGSKLDTGIEQIIAEELNVKNVVCTETVENLLPLRKEGGMITVSLDSSIDDSLRAEGLLRELVRAVNQSRKNMNLNPGDHIVLTLGIGEGLKSVLDANLANFQRAVVADSIEFGQSEGEDMKVGDEIAKIKIEKK